MRYDVATKIMAANKAEKMRRRRVVLDDDWRVGIKNLLSLAILSLVYDFIIYILSLVPPRVNNYIIRKIINRQKKKSYFDKSEIFFKKLLQFIKRCDIISKSDCEVSKRTKNTGV